MMLFMVAIVELDAQQSDAAAEEKGKIAQKDMNVWTVRTYIQSQIHILKDLPVPETTNQNLIFAMGLWNQHMQFWERIWGLYIA